MQIKLNIANGTEEYFEQCEECENCEENPYYAVNIVSHYDYKQYGGRCNHCEDCVSHGCCEETVYSGKIAEQFLDLMSLDYVSIKDFIFTTIRNAHNNGSLRDGKSVYGVNEKIVNKIYSYLSKQNILFSYLYIPDHFYLLWQNNGEQISREIYKQIDKTFNSLTCLKQILLQYVSTPQFFNNENSIAMLSHFGICYLPQEYSEYIRELQLYEKICDDISEENVIDYAKEYSTEFSKKEKVLRYPITEMTNYLGIFTDYIFRNNLPLGVCRNCGRFFILENRSDTLYCDREAPQSLNKSCKQYGAQNTWQEKLKTDETAGLYRKVYQSKQMLYRRNLDISEYKTSFDKFKEMSKEWKAAIKVGDKTEEEYRAWLKDVQGKKVL